MINNSNDYNPSNYNCLVTVLLLLHTRVDYLHLGVLVKRIIYVYRQ